MLKGPVCHLHEDAAMHSSVESASCKWFDGMWFRAQNHACDIMPKLPKSRVLPRNLHQQLAARTLLCQIHLFELQQLVAPSPCAQHAATKLPVCPVARRSASEEYRQHQAAAQKLNSVKSAPVQSDPRQRACADITLPRQLRPWHARCRVSWPLQAKAKVRA